MKANLTAVIVGNFKGSRKTGNRSLDQSMETHWPHYKRQVREAIFKLRQLALEDNELARETKEEKIFNGLVKSLADGEATRDLTVPPNWLGVIKCQTCGEVPYLEELHGAEVQACPWCHTCYRDEDAELPTHSKAIATWQIKNLVTEIKEWRK